jgi:predicted Zn-dependent peptidase
MRSVRGMPADEGTAVAPERIEICGLPAFTASLPALSPTPTVAALEFRVGRADESLARSGLTHLVEHLAMFAAGDVTFEVNAFVDDTRTVFYASGEPSEVGGFLTGIAGSLHALPLERLDLEKRVLETESDKAPAALVSRLLAGRFGLRTYGLSKYRELGIATATADDVRAWTAERFTRGNAALWIAGEVPEDLEFELPDGPRFPPPPTTPLPRLELPIYLEQGTGGAAAGFILPRHYSSTLAMSIALERLRRSLRVDRAVSYAPGGSYLPLTGDTAHASLAADALDEHVLEVRDEIVRVVCELADDGPTEDELARDRQLAGKHVEDAGNVAGRLDAAAMAELMGVPPASDEELRAELEAVDAKAIAERMGDARASMVLIAPAGLPDPGGTGLIWGRYLTPALEGRRFRPRRVGLKRGRNEVVLSDAGITLWRPEGEPLTILFDECEAVETPARGTFVLHAVDESAIQLRPAAFRHGEELEAAIRTAIPRWKFLPAL